MKGIHDVIWNAEGRVPVIIQDAGTGMVLALDEMDQAALAATLATGEATYWVPEDGTMGGCAAGGPRQMVVAAHLSCDGRCILLEVQTAGPLCQTQAATCFAATLSAETAVELVTRDWTSAEGLRSEAKALPDVAIRWSSEAAEGA